MFSSKLIRPVCRSTRKRPFLAIASTANDKQISSPVWNNNFVPRRQKSTLPGHHDHDKDYSGLQNQVAIVGAKSLVREGMKRGQKEQKTPSTTALIRKVLDGALEQAGLTTLDLDGVVAVPSLYGNHFMEAHFQATALGLFAEREKASGSNGSLPPRPLRCRTLDTGGAGPVSALLEAERMISSSMSSSSSGGGMEVVAVIAADTVGSMTGDEFLQKADSIFFKLRDELGLPLDSVASPAIPHGYDAITKHQLSSTSLTREQLRMVVSLESFHAGLHPESLQSQKAKATESHSPSVDGQKNANPFTTLDQIKASPSITPNISLLECARRADGAACLILASNRFLKRRNLWKDGIPAVIGGGQFSGPLYPPNANEDGTGGITDHTYASCQQAMDHAYASAGNLTARDIQYFGLYDCFPICLTRAIEACGLAGEDKGQDCKTGGDYIQKQYGRMLEAIENGTSEALLLDPTFFPINTHGGLLCFGAPWEVPAMFGVVEAVDQITGQSKGRGIDDCRRALVYGNGGVLSASAVAILAAG